MFKALLILFLCGMTSFVSLTQDESDYFPIVENCIPEPTLPPDDWSYAGTIMMSGYAGVHGMNAEWDTPRVLVFESVASNGDSMLIGGSLSPNGQWYAMPMGEFFVEVSFNHYNFVRSVRVYKTDGTRDYIEFALNSYDFYSNFERAWSYLPIHWIDDESFVIGGILFYPFEGIGEPASFDTDTSSLYPWAYSPDSQLIYDGRKINGEYLHATTYGNIEDFTFAEMPSLDALSWKRDSSEFIGAVENTDFVPTHLSLFDRNGQLLDKIIPIEPRQFGFVKRLTTRRNESQWSPDDTKFVLTMKLESYLDPNVVHIIDLETRQVINTCLDTINVPIWSPDGQFLAYLDLTSDNQNIIVVDLELGQAFIVGKHIGTSSEMLGWRE